MVQHVRDEPGQEYHNRIPHSLRVKHRGVSAMIWSESKSKSGEDTQIYFLVMHLRLGFWLACLVLVFNSTPAPSQALQCKYSVSCLSPTCLIAFKLGLVNLSSTACFPMSAADLLFDLLGCFMDFCLYSPHLVCLPQFLPSCARLLAVLK